MPDRDDRIENLEQKVRRLQAGMLVLAVSLVAVFVLGATNKTPDELTLRRLAIMDGDGKERVVAGTSANGPVGLVYTDSNGKMRIGVGTSPGGQASILHFDSDGKMRIAAATLAYGEATVQHYDQDGNRRILAGTKPDGEATVRLSDGKGKSVWWKKSP